MEEIFEMYKRNFPYINREEKTIKEIINNENNIFFERRNNKNELIACAILNKNTILLLVVDKEYRNNGIGTSLLEECECTIIKNGYKKIVLGIGFNYLMPGVPTCKKYSASVHEKLDSMVDDKASTFFEKRGYIHSWGDCNCFDMKIKLADFNQNEYSIGDTINNILYRWANIEDLNYIIECADNACQYQDEKFSKYYSNKDLYSNNNKQRVLVALKDEKIVGALIISMETEAKGLGNVGCTCVSFEETHQKIGTNMVKIGTKFLKDIGLKNASLSYTYSGLDVLYGAAGYEISTYYFMGEKDI